MARRVALARAIALDPELIMYDEPFAGLDLISMGVAANLIRKLNDATGATSLVVSHDVHECMAISDYALPDVRRAGASSRRARPTSCMARTIPKCASSSAASPTGRCVSTIPRAPLARRLRRAVVSRRMNLGRRRSARCTCAGCGRSATRRSSSPICCGARRPRCGASAWCVAQIHAIGNRSLVIILASGTGRRLRAGAADVLRARHLRRGRIARA